MSAAPRPAGWRRRPLLVVLAGALGWSLEWRSAGEDPSLRRVREAGKLVVALDPTSEPFSAVDAGGRLGGLDVDLARLVASRVGVAADLLTLDAGSLFDSVLARKCNLAAGVPPVRAFANDLRYSRPYYNAGQVLLMGSGLARAEGGRPVFAVEEGSVADAQLATVRKRLGNVVLERVADLDTMLAQLRAGHVGGLVLDLATARRLASADAGLVVVFEPLTWEPLVFAAHPADARLLREVNATLDALEREGVLRDLARTWVG